MNKIKKYDRVLVRDSDNDRWEIRIFLYENNLPTEYPYMCSDCHQFAQCIPFEGNEQLLGTVGNPKGDRWKPKKQDTYWYLDYGLRPYITNYVDCTIDKLLYNIGNCFKSKEEAQKMANKIKRLLKEG